MNKFPNTIKEIQKGLIEKKFSAVEMTRYYLDKIKKENSKFNIFLSLTDDLALAQAKEVDKKINRKEKLGPLEGIPIAFKDNILVEDYRATSGSKILEKYKAPYDATVTEKLKSAGAIILGKTNLDEFAMGSSTESSAFGVTKNPLDISRVPGGSSGGSAAAVAAEQCIVAFGSDTGGSVRQPGSFCGVTAFRPTYGSVSRYGLMAMASSLDQIGPLAKNAEDAQVAFDVIKGKDRLDSTTIKPKAKNNEVQLRKLKDLKIGIPEEYFEKGIDKDVKKAVEEAIAKFKKKGATIKKVSLPNTKYALAVYYIIVPAEVSSNLARYDGVKFGFREEKAKNLLEMYLQTRAKGLGDEVRRRIILGTYVLSAGYRDAYYGQAQKVRALIKQEFEKVFAEVDFLLTPTTPTTAFKIGEKTDPLAMYLSDIYVVPASLAGLPAVSVPCGKVNNLPVGLQIIGPQFKDDLVLEVAKLYEQLN